MTDTKALLSSIKALEMAPSYLASVTLCETPINPPSL